MLIPAPRTLVQVLELGAGVGLAALAAAECGARVRATDANRNSLLLTQMNAAMNGLSVEVGRLNYTATDDVERAVGDSPGSRGHAHSHSNAAADLLPSLTHRRV